MLGKQLRLQIAAWVLLGLGAVAHAGTECGWGYSYINAPNGALLLNQSTGVVDNIMRAYGETFTHSAFNLFATYVVHSTEGGNEACTYYNTKYAPYWYTTEICDGSLQNSGPGPSAIATGNYYNFLYGKGGLIALYYAWNDAAASLGLIDAFVNYVGAWGGGWTWQGGSDGLWEGSRWGVDQTYRFDQYVNSYSAGWGGMSPMPYQGQVCSTFISGLSYSATGWGISDKAYVNICNTAGLVRDAVKHACDTSIDWFQSLFVSCPATANKVTNCFLNNSQCRRDDRWYAAHCDITAYSISPDRLIGFNGNNGGGLWTANTGYAWLGVPYFSGDLVYGCWKK